jgi:hypothetical protein
VAKVQPALTLPLPEKSPLTRLFQRGESERRQAEQFSALKNETCEKFQSLWLLSVMPAEASIQSSFPLCGFPLKACGNDEKKFSPVKKRD